MYRQVWQTWSAERSGRTGDSRCERVDTTTTQTRTCTDQLRFDVQTRRIQHRWSVYRLAEVAGCGAELIAAFERGDDTIDKPTMAKLQRALGM